MANIYIIFGLWFLLTVLSGQVRATVVCAAESRLQDGETGLLLQVDVLQGTIGLSFHILFGFSAASCRFLESMLT